jgi:hypothetical protein
MMSVTALGAAALVFAAGLNCDTADQLRAAFAAGDEWPAVVAEMNAGAGKPVCRWHDDVAYEVLEHDAGATMWHDQPHVIRKIRLVDEGRAVYIAERVMLLSELPAWLGPAQFPSISPPSNIKIIVPGPKTCPPGLEVSGPGFGSRCVPNCAQGPCARKRLAQAGEQTTFRDAQGRTTGTATPDGSGGFTFRDAQGKTIGRSSTDSSGTTRYYSPGGSSLGSSTGPAGATGPARPAFPSPR